jgi:uncharacterized phage protein gp47/JayE
MLTNYADQTFEVIMERMLELIPDDVDKRQGSVVYDLLSPAAIELANAYLSLEEVKSFGVANLDMPSIYLDMRVGEFGVVRKPATLATGTINISGDVGALVPTGTRFATDRTADNVYFVTTADATIGADGTITAPITAEVEGYASNVGVNELTIVLGDLAGVIGATNLEATSGGYDAESDVDLLARYLDIVKEPATSGNAAEYKQWAKSVAGVGDAKVFDSDSPFGLGAGKVKVVLLDTEKRAQSPGIDSLVTDVSTYIESLRPVGAQVTVVGATELSIDVSVTLTLEAGYTTTTIEPAITDAIAAYLQTIAFTGEVVRVSKIANAILDTTGVIDYTNLTVNGGTSNIAVLETEVAVAGTVLLS